MAATVKVKSPAEEKVRKFSLTKGTLSLQTLKGVFSKATGLVYKDEDGEEVILPVVNDAVLSPEGGWGG